MRVYEGPPRPRSDLATVFAFDGGELGDAQFICSADGHDLQQTIRLSVHCASVVYLLPGDHVLSWRYYGFGPKDVNDSGSRMYGHAEMHVHLEAGRVYDLVADGRTQQTRLLPMAAGYELRFSDVRPGFPNAPIPD